MRVPLLVVHDAKRVFGRGGEAQFIKPKLAPRFARYVIAVMTQKFAEHDLSTNLQILNAL